MFYYYYRILKGNLAPGGAVAKITGKEGLGFTGKARAFDTEDDFVKAVESGSIKKGEKTVVILRYLGPQGGPGQFKTRYLSSRLFISVNSLDGTFPLFPLFSSILILSEIGRAHV